MTFRAHYLAAATAIAALSAPAVAQYAQPYSQQYPQSYPQQSYPQQSYPQQAYPGYSYGQQGYGDQQRYGYNQGYAQSPVGQIIDQLLGNRYNVTDRQAVSQCASAAMTQAQSQYSGYNGGYNGGYSGGYNNGYGHLRGNLRVTSITDVQRRSNGLRVSGLLSSSGGHDGQYGYQNRGYGRELSFRCNVDYRGAVTKVRIRQQ